MAKEVIRDHTGKIIGFIEDDGKGGQIARNFYGQIVGKYDKMHNVTRDFYGRQVAQGNQVLGLLWQHKV